MKVTLGFIFRGSGDRERIFRLVEPIVTNLYNFDEVITVDSGHEPFNRAASRNLVVKGAASSDVIVICDADSIPEQKPLEMAIREAYSDHKVHIPFNRVRVVSQMRFFAEPTKYTKIKPNYTYGPSCGGIFVLTPSVWEEVGGMDERVEGWGFEDRMLWSSLQTFDLGPIYHTGYLYNVNHDRDIQNLYHKENNELMDRYHAAQGDRVEMMEVQRGGSPFRP